MNHKVWPPNGNLSSYILDFFEPGYQGWGIDVGASDGVSINSTYCLERFNRWNILSVEANPDFAPLLKKERAFVEMCACADKPGEAVFHVHEQHAESLSSLRPVVRRDKLDDPKEPLTWKKVNVRVETVDRLLAKWDFPQLDLLCADTEGTELDVLRGCDLRKWKPKVIVTECWDKVGPIDLYLEGLGYVKTARNVDNDIYVRRDDE
jgi:FkbM family methyltransferase